MIISHYIKVDSIQVNHYNNTGLNGTIDKPNAINGN